jgi:hypothetical protein
MAKGKKIHKAKAETKKKELGMKVSEIPGQVSLERSPFKLRGKISYLTTDIDGLYNYILEKKRVSIATAAKRFRAKKETVEDWGKILEDHNMIEMHYPLTGDPILRIPLPKAEKGKKVKVKEFKPEKPKRHRLKMFTKKRIIVMAEIVILGELFIYIFLVNQQLRDNFLPTLNYQLSNLPAYLMNLPNYLSGRGLLINPLYFVIGIIIVVFWIVVVLVQKSKKKGK